MIRFKPGQIELPIFAVCQGSSLRCIGFSLVRLLYPDPGTLLAVAFKPMLRTRDPALDGIVHDVIDLTDVLPIRLTQHVMAIPRMQSWAYRPVIARIMDRLRVHR